MAEGHDTLRRQINDGFRDHDRSWDRRVQPIETVVRDSSRDLQAVRNDVADIRKAGENQGRRMEALERQQSRR